MLFIGIDPGLSGALAVIDNDGNLIAVSDTPVLTVQGKTAKKEYNIPAMHQVLAVYDDRSVHAASTPLSAQIDNGGFTALRSQAVSPVGQIRGHRGRQSRAGAATLDRVAAAEGGDHHAENGSCRSRRGPTPAACQHPPAGNSASWGS